MFLFGATKKNLKTVAIVIHRRISNTKYKWQTNKILIFSSRLLCLIFENYILTHTSKTTAAFRDGNKATNNSLILAVELFAAQDSVSATEAVSIWKVAADF